MHPDQRRDVLWSPQYLFIWGFTSLSTQVISRRIVGRAEETSPYSSLGFCTVNCRPTASNYQLSHLRPCWESNPGLRGGRRECYHSAIVAPLVTTVEGFTGFTGTAKDLLRSKASSRENLSLHLSSKLFKSSEVGLLLCLLLLDLGEPSERFFFLVGVDSTEDGLSVFTRPNSHL